MFRGLHRRGSLFFFFLHFIYFHAVCFMWIYSIRTAHVDCRFWATLSGSDTMNVPFKDSGFGNCLNALDIALQAQILLTLAVAAFTVAAKVVLSNFVSASKNPFRTASRNQSYHCLVLSSLWWRVCCIFNQWPSGFYWFRNSRTSQSVLRNVLSRRLWSYIWEVLRFLTI